MKFLADEGVDKSIVDGLRLLEYNVYYIVEETRALDDETILRNAEKEQRIVITRDKDFGELIYRLNKAHAGVILIRLDDLDSFERSSMVCSLIKQHAVHLPNCFAVIQRGVIRIR